MHVIILTTSDTHCEQLVGEIRDVYTNNTDLQWLAINIDSYQEERASVQWKGIDSLCVEALAEQGASAGDTHTDQEGGVRLREAADQIHRVADSLPAYGSLINVYLWPPTAVQCSDYVLLLGALRRLRDWHNARFTVFDRDLTPATEFLQRFLSADVCISADDFVMSDREVMWRGKTSICDKLENRGLTIPGVMLSKLDDDTADLKFPLAGTDKAQDGRALLGRMLEVMDEVSLASVPVFMRTPTVYKLSLYQKHPFSQVLLNYIQECTGSGLLARLAVYPAAERKVPVCGDVGLCTDAWKESIMADIQLTQEPEEELQDNYEFLHFIITSPDSSSTVENFVAFAHLLRSPYELSGSLVDSLHSLTDRADGEEEVGVELSGLPEVSEETLVSLQRDLTHLQQEALHNLLAERQASGGSSVVAESELAAYLANVRSRYLQLVAQQLPRYHDDGNHRQPSSHDKVLSEPPKTTFDWPERLMQQYHESQKRSLSRIQSSESVPMSSPMQPCETSTTVDIQDFLKYFHPDGSATADNLSPVRRRRPSRTQSKLLQPLPATTNLVPWPDCKNLSSHDIYYNTCKKAERMNQHLNKLQERYIREETYSSCTGKPVVFPRALPRKQPRPDTGLRRSPRKRRRNDLESRNLDLKSKRSVDVESRQSIDLDLKIRRSVDFEPRRSPRKKVARIYSESGAGLEEMKRASPLTFTSTSSQPGTNLPDPARRFSTSHTASQSHRRSLNASLTEGSPLERSGVNSSRTSSATKGDNARRQSIGSGKKAESRSERHKRKLQEIVDRALEDQGVPRDDPIFPSCSKRLFNVTKLFIMDLPTSRNLKEEMKKIAEGQVKQVIEVDRNRQNAAATRPRKKSAHV